MAGRFLPPDPSRGDPDTIGGYMAVHARPAAFEGMDGHSYSVAIEVDRTGDRDGAWGAYFLFIRWRRIGPQGVEGHLESSFLARGDTPADARESLGRMQLREVKARLDQLIRERSGGGSRRWWDVMREEE